MKVLFFIIWTLLLSTNIKAEYLYIGFKSQNFDRNVCNSNGDWEKAKLDLSKKLAQVGFREEVNFRVDGFCNQHYLEISGILEGSDQSLFQVYRKIINHTYSGNQLKVNYDVKTVAKMQFAYGIKSGETGPHYINLNKISDIKSYDRKDFFCQKLKDHFLERESSTADFFRAIILKADDDFVAIWPKIKAYSCE